MIILIQPQKQTSFPPTTRPCSQHRRYICVCRRDARWGLKPLTNTLHVCVCRPASQKVIPGRGPAHPDIINNHPPQPNHRPHLLMSTHDKQGSKDFHAVSITPRVLIAHMYECDDKASDDELSFKIQPERDRRGHRRGVWGWGGDSGYWCGSRPAGGKRSRLAVSYSRADFMDF